MRLKLRLLLVSIVPPRNDCGVRIVIAPDFVERYPFEFHVASNADFADGSIDAHALPAAHPFID